MNLMEEIRMQAGIISESVDEPMVSELETLIDSDPNLKRSKRNDFHKNLVVKIAQGRYDKTQAIKLFMYLADRAAKAYNARQHRGTDARYTHAPRETVGSINKATRMALAEKLRDEFEYLWKRKKKSFAEFVPKKYKGKKMGLRIRR
jgi:hypothetical protein